MFRVWLRPTVVFLAALFSAAAYAIPGTYIATPVVSDSSALTLDVRVTSRSAKGYCAAVTVRNTGTQDHQGWQVDFDLGGNTLKHLKQAKYVASGSHVTVNPYANEVNVEAGRQRQFEFCTEGSNGPSSFLQSVKLSNHPPVATLTTGYKIDDKSKDRDDKDKDCDDKDKDKDCDDKDKADYCVTVTIHNQGPDDVYDWRLKFDLGTDKLVSMEHGKADASTGFITVTPTGGHKYIKNDHDRSIKFCAITMHLSGLVYVADQDNAILKIFSTSGLLVGQINTFGYPLMVAVDETQIYAINYDGLGSIFSTNGALVRTLGQVFDHIGGVAVDGTNIYIVDGVANVVRTYSKDGTFQFAFSVSGQPYGIAVDNDNVYIAGYRTNQIQIYTKNGLLVSQFGAFSDEQIPGRFDGPWSIAVDDARIYVGDANNHLIHVFNKSGGLISAFYFRDPNPATYSDTVNIAVDSTRLYVSDADNNLVKVFGKNGVFLYSFGSLAWPQGIAVYNPPIKE